jgi:hypothetical protein
MESHKTLREGIHKTINYKWSLPVPPIIKIRKTRGASIHQKDRKNFSESKFKNTRKLIRSKNSQQKSRIQTTNRLEKKKLN